MTRKTEANRPDRSFRRLTVTRPGEVVEMDSTVLDVMVRMPDGSIRRPELTYAVDVATWSILGTLVMPKTSRGTDLGATVLGLSLLRPQDRPGWKNVTASLEDIFGTTGEWRDQLEAAAVALPRIVPESITVDRGKNFTSVAFAAACRAMEISQVFANPRTPTDKPHVESGFRSIRLGFVQFLAGYTGGSLNKRGVNLESSAVWTLAELRALLEFWVLSEWQNTPQSGLRMSSAPQQLLTPNQMFAALGGSEPVAQTGGLEFEQYLGLLPIVWRTVQPYGVNVHGFTYDSERVHPYRGQRSGLSGEANGRWEIRVDVTCPDRVWFRDHRSCEWLELSRVTPLAARPVLGVAETAVPAVPTRAFDLVRAIHEVQSTRIAAKPQCVNDKSEPFESSVVPLRLLPREEPLETDQAEHRAAQASARRLRVLE
ncbi:DDE-type integrase/transposase/recombinase [Galactobacter valiniphilus]|uniref:DDE-type integrase/transposase/recombinase n=1 Tax=Galactobacter valiniphilus TaxID=2676122 RepID=UPI00131472E0|nr:DDE-type integrase/transposase/recombinase [Galactobacter valiniphilus]